MSFPHNRPRLKDESWARWRTCRPSRRKGRQIDHRSDIFSIGIILYEMATGERPFKGDTAVSLLSSILKDTPQSATEVNPELPRDLGKIIRRCLVKDPEHRYQTAKDLRNEFEELKTELDSGQIVEEAAPITVRSRARNKIIVAVSVAVMATFVLTLLLTRSAREIPTSAE